MGSSQHFWLHASQVMLEVTGWHILARPHSVLSKINMPRAAETQTGPSLLGREDRPVRLAQVEKFLCRSPVTLATGTAAGLTKGSFQACGHPSSSTGHVASPRKGFQRQGGHHLPTQPQIGLHTLGSGEPSPRVVVRM